MNKTKIEWTATVQPDGSILPGYSSNPIKYRDADGRVAWACVKASAGCQNCYAEAISKRFRGPEAGFTAKRMEGLTPYVDEAELRAMLSPRRLPAGSKVFVGDMTDIFGPWVPFDMLDRLFAVMALRPDVVFQVLTKRPERMREYMSANEDTLRDRWFEAAKVLIPGLLDSYDGDRQCSAYTPPLPNCWLGTSVEHQVTADSRIPYLLACPAAVRFVSAEPLLRAVDFRPWAVQLTCCGLDDGLVTRATWKEADELRESYLNAPGHERTAILSRALDWVIVGGESGPGARPCDIGWIRSIVEQCKAAGVAAFVKQVGSRPYSIGCGTEGYFGLAATSVGHPQRWDYRPSDRKGAVPPAWPEDLKIREFPGGQA